MARPLSALPGALLFAAALLLLAPSPARGQDTLCAFTYSGSCIVFKAPYPAARSSITKCGDFVKSNTKLATGQCLQIGIFTSKADETRGLCVVVIDGVPCADVVVTGTVPEECSSDMQDNIVSVALPKLEPCSGTPPGGSDPPSSEPDTPPPPPKGRISPPPAKKSPPDSPADSPPDSPPTPPRTKKSPPPDLDNAPPPVGSGTLAATASIAVAGLAALAALVAA